MAYTFSVTYKGVTKYFSPPLTIPPIPPDEVRRNVAAEFDLPFGSFSIRSRTDGQIGYFHAALQGDWELILFPGLFD